MLDLVAGTERTTGELAAHFPRLSRFAVMKHLRVLQSAGLLIIRREGRKRWNLLNAVPLREVFSRWVSQHEEIFADAMLRIRDVAESNQTQRKEP